MKSEFNYNLNPKTLTEKLAIMNLLPIYEVSLEYKCTAQFSAPAGSLTEARQLALKNADKIYGRPHCYTLDNIELELIDPVVVKIQKWDERHTKLVYEMVD